MKYKIIFLLFLTSCINYEYNSKSNISYTSKGFAYISIKDNFSVSHNKLRTGTKIRISNPANETSIETIVSKKIKYDNFYKTWGVIFPTNFIKIVGSRSKRIFDFF